MGFKDKTIEKDGHKYLLEDHHKFWVELFILVAILSLLVGLYTGSNLTIKKVNKELYDVYEKIGYVDYVTMGFQDNTIKETNKFFNNNKTSNLSIILK